MDVNELVRNIAREVLKQLHEKAEKPCVMVLEERDAHLAEMVQGYLGEEADIVFFGEETGSRNPSRYILPYVSCDEMADLAVGRASGPLMKKALRLLLSGVEIEALEFEYKVYSETAPGALYSLYKSYEDTLATFGLKAFRHKQPDTVRYWQNLVTETVVSQAAGNGASTLCVPLGAVVTPLAAEAAKKANVNILKSL